MKLLLRGGRVIDPAGSVDGALDLLIEDGKIARIGTAIPPPQGAEVVDVTGKIVAPGFVDMHVHLREPGQEWKETVATGLEAAAAGGFTAVACMANTLPPNDSRSVTEHMLAAAARAGSARLHPIGAVSKGLEGKELAEIGDMVAAGIVAISDDGRPVQNAELMRRALEYARHFGIPVIQHAQDLDLSGDGVMHEGEASCCLGLPGIPGAAEDVMVARDLILLEETGGRYHVAHISTARSLEMVRAAKRRGLPVTCEVTPHHLLLADEAILATVYDTHFKMNPPLRPKDDLAALREGLADGTIDAIASDHAPHHWNEKILEFQVAPFGIVGLETSVTLVLDRLVRPGIVSLPRAIELLSTGPARALGLAAGMLAPGSVADVTILDLERPVEIAAERFRSKSRNTPFEGWKTTGAPVATIVGGRLTFRADGAFRT